MLLLSHIIRGVQMKAAGIIVFIALCGAATAGAAGMSPKQELGKKIFFDKNLSINRNQSCATCHAAEVGWTGPDTLQNSKEWRLQRFGTRAFR